MNTDDGALDFDVYFNNKGFNKAVDESEKRVKGFSSAVVAEGEKIDDAFKITAENIRIQKDVIAKLETEIGNLNIEISKLPAGSKGQVELKKQASQLTAELTAEKVALKQLEAEVKQTETAHVSFRTQLRNAREDLIRMEQAGLRGSDAYNALQKKLGDLKDAMDDAQQQAAVLANDERGFQGVISTLSGVTGAMSAAQGAVGLFAGENENLQKIMLKVQSLMAITIGLQQVAQTLNKDSYFRIVMLTKAKEMWAVANLKVATTLGISTAAAQALMATLTLGLSVAITAIIVGLSKLASRAAEARKEAKAFNEAVADSAFKSIASVHQLSVEWTSLGNNIKAKEKFIEENAEKFKELGASVKSVQEAEKLLVDQKDSFISSLILRARAMAATEFAAQKYKEALQKQLQLEETPKTKTVEHTSINPRTGTINSWTTTKENKDYAKIESEKNKLEAEGLKLFQMAAEFTQKEKQILENLGISNNEIVEGSIKALEDSISKLQERYKKAATDKERGEILKELNAQKALLDKMDKSDDKAKDTKAEEEKARTKALKEYDDQLKEQLDNANSVLEKLDILKKMRQGLGDDKSELGKGKASILGDADKDVAKEVRDQTKQLLNDYATYLGRKIKLQKDYNDEMILLQKQLDAETNPEEKARIQGAMNNRTDSFNRSMKYGGDTDYESMLREYGSFEQKKQMIIDDFEQKRKKAQEAGNEELAQQLAKAQEKAISGLAVDELVGTEAWSNLFGNLDELTTQQIDILLQEIETKFSQLSVKFDPVDLKAIQEKLREAKQMLYQDNPFKQLGIAIKATFLSGAKDSKTAATDIKKNWKNLAEATEGSFKFVQDAIGSAEFLKEAIGEVGATAITSLATIATVAVTVSAAIKTAEKSSVILAIIQAALIVIQAVANVFKSIFAKHDKDIEKQIEKHKAAVEGLKDAYEDLERAVEKALGGDTYQKQQQMIKNLEKQREQYLAMIAAERSKKKADNGKIDEYLDAYKGAGRQIEDILAEITNDILQTTAKDFADQLGNAIADAFGKGEDAALAFGETVNDIMKNAILNQLKKNFLEKQLQGALDDLYKSMGYWEGDTFVFDGLTAEEQQKFKDKVAQIGQNFTSALDLYSDLFKGLTDQANTSLSGGIQSVSEETASILAGQVNAIRISQIEAITVLRDQLQALNDIRNNTAMQVSKLIEIINIMRSSQTDPLRGQGIM